MAVLMNVAHEGLMRHLPYKIARPLLPLAFALVSTLPAATIGLLVFIWTTSRFAPSSDSECRCRMCGYILKGLSKPQCPECGEAV